MQERLQKLIAQAGIASRRHAEELINNDPLVQEMMRQFKTARIVPGSVKPH